MIDERLENLLWSELEGGLTEEDHQHLEERLAQDADARAARERLSMLNEGLSSLPPAQPPEELRPRIRQALAGRRARPRSSFLKTLRAAFGSFSLTQARFAYLVAGLLAGVAISLLLAGGLDSPAAIDPGVLYGTAILDHGEWMDLDLPEGAGTVRLRRDGSRLTTTVSAEGALDVAINRSSGGRVTVIVSRDGSPIFEQQLDLKEIPGS